jgi:hypothetical protein
MGTPPRIAAPGERGLLSLDGKDVIVIQTKATRLKPYVFGQALLSMDLIRQRWVPRSLRSVLICAADDAELRPIAGRSPICKYGLSRQAACTTTDCGAGPAPAAEVASRARAPVVVPAKLSSRLSIDDVLIPGAGDVRRSPLARLVVGQDVTSIHSSADRGSAGIGMYIGGEVITAQALLTAMGATSATSVILSHHGDDAVEEALRRHATFQLVQPGLCPSCRRRFG